MRIALRTVVNEAIVRYNKELPSNITPAVGPTVLTKYTHGFSVINEIFKATTTHPWVPM